ncbi:MAG: DUF4383 domain-containing protein [Thermoleophilia bacterium]
MSTPPPTTLDPARARAVTGTARIVSGVLFSLGLLGVLNTGVDDLGADSAEQLFLFLVHPLTAVAWLVLGFVGIAMATRPDWARRYLIGAGSLLLLWALLALLLGDDATQVLTRDTPVVVLHIVGGVMSLAAALAPLPEPVARVLAPPSTTEGSS